MTSNLDTSMIEGVMVADVTAWLASLGWRRKVDYPRPELLVFEGSSDDDGKPLTAVIPSDVTSADFRDRLTDLVRLIADVTGRTANDTAADLTAADADLVQVRVMSDFSSRGSLPLDYAAVMTVALRELLVSSACVEELPKASYSRATKSAVLHAQKCRFGQTRRGSFIATVESPVAPVLGGPSAPISMPFERRVVERIFRGVKTLHDAVLDGRGDALLGGWGKGLNANMCESLVRLRGSDTETVLEFSAHWSRRIAPRDGLGAPIRIDRTGFELLEAAGRALRATTAGEVRDLSGKITALATARTGGDEDEDDDDGDDTDRVATLRFDESGRGRFQNARVVLEESDYKIACDAHRDGRVVSLRGRLDKRGKRWWIADVEGFRPG